MQKSTRKGGIMKQVMLGTKRGYLVPRNEVIADLRSALRLDKKMYISYMSYHGGKFVSISIADCKIVRENGMLVKEEMEPSKRVWMEKEKFCKLLRIGEFFQLRLFLHVTDRKFKTSLWGDFLAEDEAYLFFDTEEPIYWEINELAS